MKIQEVDEGKKHMHIIIYVNKLYIHSYIQYISLSNVVGRFTKDNKNLYKPEEMHGFMERWMAKQCKLLHVWCESC